MAIVGFNFTKITAERTGTLSGKIQIKNNVGITDVKEYKMNIGSKIGSGMTFLFKYTTEYAPKIGSIVLEGEVLYMEDEKKTKEMLDAWEKNRTIDKNVMVQIMNAILAKANIQALNRSQDIGLPAPLQLPKVNVKEPSKKK